MDSSDSPPSSRPAPSAGSQAGSPPASPGSTGTSTGLVPVPLPVLMITSWFGSGLSPLAPGTMGSLAALPVAWGLVWAFGPWGLGWGLVVVFLVGLAASHVQVRTTGEQDPSRIVVDEVVGQWITLLVAPLDPMAYLAGFLLFRFFDIAKVWPANAIEQHLPGALGIMLDDVAAGLLALAALSLVVTWPLN